MNMPSSIFDMLRKEATKGNKQGKKPKEARSKDR
jgi:hypothetical protein